MFNFIRELWKEHLKHRRETITLYIYNQDQLNKYINNGVFNSDGYSVYFNFDVEGDFDIFARTVTIGPNHSIKVNNITCQDLIAYSNISAKNITTSGYIHVVGYEGNLTAENITAVEDIKIGGSLKANDVVMKGGIFDVRQADIGNLNMNSGKVESYDWSDEDEDEVSFHFRANNVVGVTYFNVKNAIVNNLKVHYEIKGENIVANDIKSKRIFIDKKLEAKDICAEIIGDSSANGDIVARDISAGEIRSYHLTARDIKIGHEPYWNGYLTHFIKTSELKARNVNISLGELRAHSIDVNDITAPNILAFKISANRVSYYDTCIALHSFRCSSVSSYNSQKSLPACCVENDIEIKEP